MNYWMEGFLLASRDAAVLALIIGLLILLVGRFIPAGWRHALWLLVAVRLMMPVLPTSPTSLQGVIESKAIEITQIEKISEVEPVSIVPPIAESPNDTLVSDSPIILTNVSRDEVGYGEDVVQSAIVVPVNVEVKQKSEGLTWREVIFYLWITGSLFFLSMGSLLTWRFWRKLRKPVDPHPQQVELELLLEQLVSESKWRNRPCIRVTDLVKSPAIFGLFRPAILVPPTSLECLSESELKLVLMHELGHWRRCDLWVNLILSFLQALHWFNPMIWWAFHRTRVESERATDAWVLRRAGEGKAKAYGEVLLRLLDQGARPKAVFSGLVGVVESPRDIKRRIKGIVRFTGKRNRLVGFASIAILLGMAAVGLTQSPVGDGEPGDTLEPKPEKMTSSFTCRVISSEGDPVSGAKVYYQADIAIDQYSRLSEAGVTDEEGVCKISFQSELPRNLKMFVHHPTSGYGASTKYTPRFKGECLISLSRGMPLSFKVIDEQGKPVSNLRLRVAKAIYPADYFESFHDRSKKTVVSEMFGSDVPELPEGFWSGVTDAQGRCSIQGLRPGLYYVNHNDERYAQIPGLYDRKIHHNPEHQQGDIELKLLPALSIAGTVRLSDGTPVEGAEVVAHEGGGGKYRGCMVTTTTDANGYYKLGRLLPTFYDLRVNPKITMRNTVAPQLGGCNLGIGESRKGVDFVIEEGGLISGRVTLSDTGEGAPNCTMTVLCQDKATGIAFWSVSTDENGFYRVRIPEGKMMVYSSGLEPGGYTDSTIKSPQMKKEFQVENGKSYQADFSFFPKNVIRGTVLDSSGIPVVGAKVSCLHPRNTFREFNNSVSDEEGNFSFELPADTKKAWLVAGQDGKISDYETRYPVSSDVKLVLKERVFASATGIVVDSEGRPIQGARVWWDSYPRIPGISYGTVTDENGRFETKQIIPDDQVVFSASKDSYGRSSSHAAFEAGRSIELGPIVLPRADAFVSGRVIDPAGNPVADAKVTASGYKQPRVTTVTDQEGKFVINGVVDAWLDLEVFMESGFGKVYTGKERVRAGTNTTVIELSSHSLYSLLNKRTKLRNYVGKKAPPLKAQHWFNSAALPEESPGKIRLIKFVGMDRSLIFFSNILPSLQKLRKEHPEEELEIIVVHGAWPKEEVTEILAQEYPDFKLPLAIEPKQNPMSKSLGVEFWQTVVIDQEGKVVFQSKGDWKQAKQKVRQLLGKGK